MIDTLKVGVPLTRHQWQYLTELAAQDDRWVPALVNRAAGEIRVRHETSVLSTDSQSFHRELRWAVPGEYTQEGTYLYLELSLPKLWYGHNVRLLYNWVKALELLRDWMNEKLRQPRMLKYPKVIDWKVFRADVCYAWKFPSQRLAEAYLCTLQKLSYPRKKPIIYPCESILFTGATYSFKFYLKLPEFIHHDEEELINQGASQDLTHSLRSMATGVLRCEATLRRKWLTKNNIDRVSDLLRDEFWFTNLDGSRIHGGYEMLRVITILVHLRQSGEDIDFDNMKDGEILSCPENTCLVSAKFDPDRGLFADIKYEAQSYKDGLYVHKSGSDIISRRWNLQLVLQFFIGKFVGENSGVEYVDTVEEKLLAIYKPVKAARLTSVWLYIQRFGPKKAKEAFGHDSYYAARRDMIKAGISIIEPPANVKIIERDFLERFKLQVPSQDAVNLHDDFRDGENLLNFKANT
jgi:hypothetical protein